MYKAYWTSWTYQTSARRVSYKELKSYQQAVTIYDFTVECCQRYIDPRSWTTDRMVQAARSGKQNIVEAVSERTSKASELKLLGVARASFEELAEDYSDFLRQRDFSLWSKDDPRAVAIRKLAYDPSRTYETYSTYLAHPESAANTILCLIRQATFLLDRQISVAERLFVQHGDYQEGLEKARGAQQKREILDGWWRKHTP